MEEMMVNGSGEAAAGAMTPPRAAGARGRVASPPTPLMNASSYRSMILLEKKRKSHEVAAGDLKNVLLEETLDALRNKAAELQHDNWMFQDAQG